MSVAEIPDPKISIDNVINELRSMGVMERLIRRATTEDQLRGLLKGLRRLEMMHGEMSIHN